MHIHASSVNLHVHRSPAVTLNLHVHRPPAVTLNETTDEFHISTGLR